MERDSIIFWFLQSPKVGRGAYNGLTELWGGVSQYIILGEWGEERRKLNWNDERYGKAKVVYLNREGCQNIEEKVKKIIDDNPNAIHILFGFANSLSKLVCKYTFNKPSKICVITERPNMYGNFAWRIARKIYVAVKYRFIYKRFDRHIQVLLPLGRKGVEEYASFGWKREKMFPFMYCPEAKACVSSKRDYSNKTVKFLYVGRFMFETKGLDVLMKAFERVEGNWQIDFVGGYGKNREEMLSWINERPNARFLGVWDSNHVIENISQYDVAIVPSKYEGWNMIVYEAIMAGIGVIATEQSTSDEIISSSGAGIVVKPYSVQSLQSAIQNVIDNPNILNTWREKAQEFQINLLPNRVAQYFVDIMDYTFYEKETRPECPWL